jgi:hypothetical protein
MGGMQKMVFYLEDIWRLDVPLALLLRPTFSIASGNGWKASFLVESELWSLPAHFSKKPGAHLLLICPLS